MVEEHVETAVKEFRKVQVSLRDFGATDTEPDGVWQYYIAVRLGFRSDRRLEKPRSPEDWQIYTGRGDRQAATTLTRALTRLEKALKTVSRNLTEEVMEEHLWRVI